MTARFNSLQCVSAAHHTEEQFSETGRQNPKAYIQAQSIIKCSSSLSQDTWPLRRCSRNRAQMLLKSHLIIKCHSLYINVIRLLQHISAHS